MRTAEALIVTPFSRSRSIVSSICSDMSRSEIVPVSCSRRSASVDLPWSIWAIMQKLRIWSVILAFRRLSLRFCEIFTGKALYAGVKSLAQYHVSGWKYNRNYFTTKGTKDHEGFKYVGAQRYDSSSQPFGFAVPLH